MARDSRHGKDRAKQVSLSKRAAESGRKKTDFPVGRVVLMVLGLLAVIAGIFFVRAVIQFVRGYVGGSGGNAEAPKPYEGDSRVAYYLFGLFGEDETKDLEMLSLVCYDKDAKTVHVMQIPTSTYLGETDKWVVPTVGAVWGNPKPLNWCDTCRRQVYDGEIEDGRHNANTESGIYCGTQITQKTGSAVDNLLEVFRHQYAIELDNFYLLPQEALVKLVNWVGGIDVELTYPITLAGTDYPAGVQTIDGEAALEYVCDAGTTITSELQNLKTQRRVYAALFERLFRCDRTYLDDEVLWPVMKGSTPIRTRRDNYISEDITLMIDLVQELSTLPRENIAVYLLPGEPATADGVNYYSVHKKELSEMLNAAFNPKGPAIAEEHLRMTELANTVYDDMEGQTMAELLVEQSGKLPEEDSE